MDTGNGFHFRRTSRQTKVEDQPDKHYKKFNSRPSRLPREPITCTVSGTLAVVLRMSRIFGLAPLEMKRLDSQGETWEIKVSKKAYVYSMLLITTLNMITLVAIVMDLTINYEQSVRMRSPTKSVIWLMDTLAVILTTDVSACTAPATMRNMCSLLNRLQKISSDLNSNPMPARLDKRLKCTAVSLLLLSFFMFFFDYFTVAAYSLDKHRNKLILGLYTAFYILYYNLIFVSLLFGLTVLIMNNALKAVNDHLDRLGQIIPNEGLQNMENNGMIKMYEELGVTVPLKSINIVIDKITNITGLQNIENNGIIKTHEVPLGATVPLKSINIVIDKITNIKDIKLPKKKSAPESIRALGFSYMEVCELIGGVNQCFGVIMLMMLITTLMHLITTPYFLLTALITKTDMTRTSLTQAVWTIKHFITMLLLVEPCHWTYQEILRTRTLTVQLSSRTATAMGPFVVELRRFFWCISLNKMVYAPLGVCTLTRHICAVIMGAVTTYLVVVIQFNTTDDAVD